MYCKNIKHEYTISVNTVNINTMKTMLTVSIIDFNDIFLQNVFYVTFLSLVKKNLRLTYRLNISIDQRINSSICSELHISFE